MPVLLRLALFGGLDVSAKLYGECVTKYIASMKLE
jgi:hypothetical protein